MLTTGSLKEAASTMPEEELPAIAAAWRIRLK